MTSKLIVNLADLTVILMNDDKISMSATYSGRAKDLIIFLKSFKFTHIYFVVEPLADKVSKNAVLIKEWEKNGIKFYLTEADIIQINRLQSVCNCSNVTLCNAFYSYRLTSKLPNYSLAVNTGTFYTLLEYKEKELCGAKTFRTNDELIAASNTYKTVMDIVDIDKVVAKHRELITSNKSDVILIGTLVYSIIDESNIKLPYYFDPNEVDSYVSNIVRSKDVGDGDTVSNSSVDDDDDISIVEGDDDVLIAAKQEKYSKQGKSNKVKVVHKDSKNLKNVKDTDKPKKFGILKIIITVLMVALIVLFIVCFYITTIRAEQISNISTEAYSDYDTTRLHTAIELYSSAKENQNLKQLYKNITNIPICGYIDEIEFNGDESSLKLYLPSSSDTLAMDSNLIYDVDTFIQKLSTYVSVKKHDEVDKIQESSKIYNIYNVSFGY